MRTYTLHIPPDAGSPEIALERARLVPEGFCRGAFFFGFLWFWVKGFFLAGCLALLGFIALCIVLGFTGVVPGAWLTLILAYHILLALEADTLMRWTHARRGLREVMTVAAKDFDEAERTAFHTWVAEGVRERTEPEVSLPATTASEPLPMPSEASNGGEATS